MNSLARSPKVIFFLAILAMAILAIGALGLRLGTDFKGGTHFQIELADNATPDQMQTIRSVIEQRMDSFGLKDTTVSPAGNRFLDAKIAESDPKEIESIERILRTQGKFEVLFDGNVLITGSDIIQIVIDPTNGYKVVQEEKGYRWILPFILKESAAEKFSRGVFHKCIVTGYGSGGERDYECEKTYFFIDRPADSVLVIPKSIYTIDSALFSSGAVAADIPSESSLEDFLKNTGAPYVLVDANFGGKEREQLKGYKSRKAIVPASIDVSLKEELKGMGYTVKEVAERENIPWVWIAAGGKSIIRLTEGITNDEPYIKDSQNAKIFSHLTITGSAATKEQAASELSSLRIILETGSLPIGINDISKEVVSPLLGADFLNQVLVMGVAAVFAVAAVIFIKYRRIKLTLPIMFIVTSEIVIVLGFAAVIKWSLDLASVVGMIAAIGTGVDDQIVITDEMSRKEEESAGSLLSRIKKAFFIVFASACTSIATMAPILIFGSGLGNKLMGFALTTIVGVLVGVIVTRPAYSEIVKAIMENDRNSKK